MKRDEAKLLELHKRGGNLFLLPTRAGQARARQLARSDRYSTDEALKVMLAEYLSGTWRWVEPHEIGALTDAPIITDEDLSVFGSRVYWHERYQVDDPIAIFADGGDVRFDGVEG